MIGRLDCAQPLARSLVVHSSGGVVGRRCLNVGNEDEQKRERGEPSRELHGKIKEWNAKRVCGWSSSTFGEDKVICARELNEW